MESKHITVENISDNFNDVIDALDKYIIDINITGRQKVRFNLLAEEALRLAKSISSEDAVEIWFEGNTRLSSIVLMVKTNLTPRKKSEFLSLSTSENSDKKSSFFETLKQAIKNPSKSSWSLAEYEASIMAKRGEDKYSLEAWENLERSVLANLSDDINVNIKNNYVMITITKDFTSSLSKIGSTKPFTTTEQILFDNDDNSVKEAQSKVDSCITSLNLSGKDDIHAKLLFEESIGLVHALTGEYSALIWGEKYLDEIAIKLICYTKMDTIKKDEFLVLSKKNTNALAKGFMGKIRDMVQTGVLNYDYVMSAPNGNGGSFDFNAIGTYYNMGMVSYPTSMWSLNDYRSNLNDLSDENMQQYAWDELEKSIVAKVADDVIVGIKKDYVEMTFICKINQQS